MFFAIDFCRAPPAYSSTDTYIKINERERATTAHRDDDERCLLGEEIRDFFVPVDEENGRFGRLGWCDSFSHGWDDEEDELFFGVFFGSFERKIPVVRIREWIPDRNVFRSE